MRYLPIGRAEMLELCEKVLIANTPASLFKALTQSEAVERLGTELSAATLSERFDELTARHRQTLLVVSLSYAVLVAVLVYSRGGGAVDATRLEWGRAFVDLANRGASNSSIVIAGSHPEVRTYDAPGAVSEAPRGPGSIVISSR